MTEVEAFTKVLQEGRFVANFGTEQNAANFRRRCYRWRKLDRKENGGESIFDPVFILAEGPRLTFDIYAPTIEP